MSDDLMRWEEKGRGIFDLSGIRDLVHTLKRKFRVLDARIICLNTPDRAGESQPGEAEAANKLCMDLNRILIPVHYCKNGDLFQVDLALPVPAFPEFGQLEKLASLDASSDSFKFLYRQMQRNANRVHYFLRQAVRRLEAEGL